MEISVPKLLNVPTKLLPLITELDNYRYFLIDGGRSSGKTQTVARLLTYLCDQSPLRVVCGRETQSSIEESVYTVFTDLIHAHSLDFRVGATKIDHSNGSAIRFRGFREQGSTNIKGLEGVDVLWCDEAQAIAKQTLDTILPTIRKQNSRIIFTMNRHTEQDSVFVAMAGRPDCLHIHQDYTDNPFCPQAMLDEAKICKERSLEDYTHIWEGAPLKKGDDALFTLDEIFNSSKIEFIVQGMRKRILSVDIARYGDDETVFNIIESYNVNQWSQIFMDFWKNKSTMETVGRIVEFVKEWNIDNVIIDDVGVGGGVTDRLSELRIPVTPFIGSGKPSISLYTNIRSESFFKLKDMLSNKTLKILKDNVLQSQLSSIRYEYLSNGKKGIVSKDRMRKDGFPSPDRADALAMAVHYREETLDNRETREDNWINSYKMEEAWA